MINEVQKDLSSVGLHHGWLGLSFDLPEDGIKVSDLSKKIGGVLRSIEKFNTLIFKSIDSKCKPQLRIVKVEEGSIEVWLITIGIGLGTNWLSDVWSPFKKTVERASCYKDGTDAHKHFIKPLEECLHDMCGAQDIDADECLSAISGICKSIQSYGQGCKCIFSYDERGNKANHIRIEPSFIQVKKHDQDKTQEEVTQVELRLVSPVLDGNGKWRFKSKDMEINAIVSDNQFLSRLHNGEISIRADDLYKVTLSKTIYDDGRIHYDISDIKVRHSKKGNTSDNLDLFSG